MYPTIPEDDDDEDEEEELDDDDDDDDVDMWPDADIIDPSALYTLMSVTSSSDSVPLG